MDAPRLGQPWAWARWDLARVGFGQVYLALAFNSAERAYKKPNPEAFNVVLEASAGAEAV